MGSSTLLAQLPVLLIATASVLLDHSFRKELVKDRLSCQVWLWLALSLSHPSQEQHVLFHAWVHGVIFSNILSTVASWKLTSWEPLSGLLAPSAWITMTLTLPNGASSDALQSMGIYLLSFSVLWASQWHIQRTPQDLQGIPSTRSDLCMKRFGLKSAPPDDREWINWRQSQVLQWMSAALDDEDANIVTSVLAAERIPGSILDTLSVQQLLQLNVPYGPACLLSRHIQILVRSYPPQRTATSGVYVSSSPRASAIPAGRHKRAYVPNVDEEELIPEPQPDWLTLHDQQYNHPPQSDHASRPKNAPIKSYHADPVIESFTFEGSEQQLRMEQMMMERYGLELPKLRTPDEMQASPPEDEYPPAATLNYARAPASVPLAPSAKDPMAPVPITKEDVMAAIPPLIFKQMPPHIQEIAKRNPELVQQLMGTKEQEIIPPPDNAVASKKLARDNAHWPTPDQSTSIPEADQETEGEQEEDFFISGIDDERTSLIQRTAASKYRSIT